jgi:hypothetical protein
MVSVSYLSPAARDLDSWARDRGVLLLGEMGLEVDKADPALARILERVKARETEGYSYDTAQASFELLARDELGLLPEFFEVKRYRVTVERRKNKYNKMVSLSEAVVVVKVDGEKIEGPFYRFTGDLADNGKGKLFVSKAKNPYLSIYDKYLED